VVGAGGLGSHIVQQLAFLGVGHLTVIDSDELDRSNLNRLVGSRFDDPIPGTKKVDIAKRLVQSIDPSIGVTAIPKDLRTRDAFDVLESSDCVFGCLDNDGGRLILNELCVAFEIPYFDLATDIPSDDKLYFGGRIFLTNDSSRCLYCSDEISTEEAAEYLASREAKMEYQNVYGVRKAYLDNAGPSVISLNGVIASLAITEFIALVTNIRPPYKYLRYSGNEGVVRLILDGPINKDCYYCHFLRGKRDQVDIRRYCLLGNV
jgi:molybdopterin/thiamine biosynthesis adenylyltransferase